MQSRNMSRSTLGLILAGAVALIAEPTRAAGPFDYHSLTPCRLADTRNPAGASGGPILRDNQIRFFPVQGLCGVPAGAKAVSVNVTAVAPNGAGFLTLFAASSERPQVSNLNYDAFERALSNGAVVPLANQAQFPYDLAVFARVGTAGGTVHMVLDVTGYFQ